MILTEKAKRNIEILKENEGSNKAFAAVTGINAATTSKMSTASSVSEKHLDRILKAYNLSIDEFFHSNIENRIHIGSLAKTYYGYFLTTWDNTPARVDSSVMTISDDNIVVFEINLSQQPSKVFEGNYTIDENFFYINLSAVSPHNDYRASIIMPWDKKISPPKIYYGGLGLLSLPSDGGTVLCTQKILFSNLPLNVIRNDLNSDYVFLQNCLAIDKDLNYIKIRKAEDYDVFLFLRNLNNANPNP